MRSLLLRLRSPRRYRAYALGVAAVACLGFVAWLVVANDGEGNGELEAVIATQPETASLDMEAISQDLEATPGISDSSAQINLDAIAFDSLQGADWADSLPVPPWVVNPSLSFSRRYESLPGSPSRSRDAGARTAPSSTAPAVLVVRLQGRAVVLEDIGLGATPLTRSQAALYANFRLLDDCDWMVRAGRALPGGDRLRLSGELARAGGDWMFALAAPAGECDEARARGYVRSSPDRKDRTAVVQAVRAGGVEPAGVTYTDRDVREYTKSPAANDGTRYVWAVLRQAESTQVAPPPVVQQTAVVLQVSKNGEYRVLWSKNVISAEEKLGLAGVFDMNRDRIADGIFAVRSPRSLVLLRVSPGPDGRWDVAEERPLRPI